MIKEPGGHQRIGYDEYVINTIFIVSLYMHVSLCVRQARQYRAIGLINMKRRRPSLVSRLSREMKSARLRHENGKNNLKRGSRSYEIGSVRVFRLKLLPPMAGVVKGGRVTKGAYVSLVIGSRRGKEAGRGAAGSRVTIRANTSARARRVFVVSFILSYSECHLSDRHGGRPSRSGERLWGCQRQEIPHVLPVGLLRTIFPGRIADPPSPSLSSRPCALLSGQARLARARTV